MIRTSRPQIGAAGFSMTQVLLGMGLTSTAILATMQFMQQSMRVNRGIALSADFTQLSSTINQVLMRREVCEKVLAGQAFNPLSSGKQNIVLKSLDTPGADMVSTATNPYASGLQVKELTLTKLSGSSGSYFARLEIKAEKKGETSGGKLLSNTFTVDLDVNESTGTITGCAGSTGVAGVPAGAILLWTNSADCPAGFTRDTSFDGLFARGALAGQAPSAAVVGSNTHTHTFTIGGSAGYTTVSRNNNPTSGAYVAVADVNHSHASSGSSAADHAPRHRTVIFCKKD